MLLKVLLAAAALAAVWQFVPIHGRTMAERWHRSRSTSEFFDRSWAEVRGEPKPSGHPRAAARPPPPHTQARAAAAPSARPAEGHTDADRKALDKILSDHVQQ